MINNFDAAKRMMNHGDQDLSLSYPSFKSKLDLFFIDHDMVPMLVQESYLNSMQDRNTLEDLEQMAEAADQISVGDQLNIQIRQN